MREARLEMIWIRNRKGSRRLSERHSRINTSEDLGW